MNQPHTLYLCDPEKNTNCRKTACKYNPNAKHQRCEATKDPAFAKLDKNGCPIRMPDFLEMVKAMEKEEST